MENIDRIAKLFSTCKEKGRPLLLVMCVHATLISIPRCEFANFDEKEWICLNLGFPFLIPLADGLTNQLAAQRALESGCRQDDVFRLVKK